MRLPQFFFHSTTCSYHCFLVFMYLVLIFLFIVCEHPMVYFDCDNATAGAKGSECQKSCSTFDTDCVSYQKFLIFKGFPRTNKVNCS